MSITRENIDLLLSQTRKLTRFEIMDLLSCSDPLARSYKSIIDNYALINGTSLEGSENTTKTYVVSGCWHIPFHNRVLYAGFKNLIRDIQPDGFVLAGDTLDMAALGEYERGKLSHTGVTLEDEYLAGNEVLDELDYLLPSESEKYYLYGNHCARYFRWKADVNNSKYGDLINPTKALKLKERGYVVKEDYQNGFIELGSLQVFHGIYFNQHAAKKHLDTLRRNCMFVHTHRFQVYREGNFAGFNIGFMGDIEAPCFSYAPRTMREAWANGFAVVHVQEDDKFYVEMIDVVNSRFVYGGKLY